MKPKIHADSPIISMLLAGIEKNPGIESKELAALVGRSWPHVKKGLAFMNAHKIAGYCELGKVRRGWFVWAEAEKRNAGFMSVKAKSKLRNSLRPPSVRSKIEAMAASEDDGVSMLKLSERLGLTEKDANRQCISLVRLGRLFRSARRGYRVRWFATETAAQSWESLPDGDNSEFRPKPGRIAQPDAVKEAARIAREERARLRREAAKAAKPKAAKKPKKIGADCKAIKPKPANDAPVVVRGKATDMRGEVDYSKAKITVCPAPVSIYRYQYDPASDAHRRYVRQIAELRGAA